MPRKKDPFRRYVEFWHDENGNKKWKCSFCKEDYCGSVTRIKAHLAGFGGYGAGACKKVDRPVRSEARKALKRKEEAAKSSNGSEGSDEEGAHQPVTANNEDALRETSVAAMTDLSFDGAPPFLETNLPNQSLPAQVPIPHMKYSFHPQYHAADSYFQPWNLSDPGNRGDLAPEALAHMPGSVNAEGGEPNTGTPPGNNMSNSLMLEARTNYALMDSGPSTCGLVDKNTPIRKRKLKELSNREAGMDESEIWCRKSLPLVTTELVGDESEEAIEEICKYLLEDEIFLIGIYGMGGVGKTAILMHVHNRVLLKNPAVFWVSVPQKFSVHELQDEIANAVGLDSLSKDKDVKRRASILHRHLEKMKSSILFLDGLWMHFEVNDVGIPIEKGGLKLVLTTRSQDVCHKMLCQKQIKIKPLCVEEDRWSLFSKKVCFREELPSEVEDIAWSILEKCGDLPLGIIEIATHMRGVEKVHEWKDLLQKLQESRMELDVLKELKLSYINLGSPQVQRCFLHLVLCFGRGICVTTEKELIESLIDEGLLGGIATRQKQHDQGNTILDKITKSCLLDDDPEEKDVYPNVHPLIREMALQIATSTTHMVKAHMGLEELPEEELWTDHLEKVFLQGNRIKDIPYGISPKCPKLTRLSLNDNVFLVAIHGSFFKHLKRLKVLDLSHTMITELPDSISHLEMLEALLLRGCEELHFIPCVGKLRSLRKLDLKGCRMLEKAPEGMEMLVKLRYLDLHGTGIETLPEGVLGKLVNLQYLAIQKVTTEEEEVIKLKKMEALYCSVPKVETFNACVRFLEQNITRQYKLGLNALKEDFFTDDDYEDYIRGDEKKKIVIGSCDSIVAWEDGGIGSDGGAVLIPRNVGVLEVGGCGGVTSLWEVGPLENLEVLVIKEWENLEEVGSSVNFPSLQSLTIKGCPKLKHLLKWEWLATTSASLPKLEKIEIEDCEELEEIIGGGPVPNPIEIGGAPTYLIRELMIKGCNKMKRVLLTQDTLLHLPFLRTVSVRDCKGVEVIIGGTVANTTTHLTDLRLVNLPGLKSICDDGGTVSCDSLRWIYIWRCPKLKKISVELPLLDNGLPSPPPSLRDISIDWKTWVSLEWDHPLARSSLQHVVKFHSVLGRSLQGHWGTFDKIQC